MKREGAISLSIAFAALTLILPQLAQAKAAVNAKSSQSAAVQEARMMVPARAYLVKNLDAKKLAAGHHIIAALRGKVHLKNGPELPSGTKLVGTVVVDKLAPGGKSRMALRFTQARLKNGKAIPIHATIMGIATPDYDNEVFSGTGLLPWKPDTLQLDQEGVFSGVDLHSKIAGKNSGVFVFSRKDVRLSAGSQLELAIAPRKSSRT